MIFVFYLLNGYQLYCKKCVKIYAQSDGGRKAQKQYNQSLAGRQSTKKYEHSEKGKRTKRQYNHSESGKDAQRRHSKTDKRKDAQGRHNQTEGRRQNKKKSDAVCHTRKTQAGGSYTTAEWYALCEFYDFHCLMCGHQFPFDKLTVDHIKPVSKDGTSFIWNLQPLCMPCNASKGTKTIDYRDKNTWVKQLRLF